jgi:hypothetical protein
MPPLREEEVSSTDFPFLTRRIFIALFEQALPVSRPSQF